MARADRLAVPHVKSAFDMKATYRPLALTLGETLWPAAAPAPDTFRRSALAGGRSHQVHAYIVPGRARFADGDSVAAESKTIVVPSALIAGLLL